jgi:hypothetical protein
MVKSVQRHPKFKISLTIYNHNVSLLTMCHAKTKHNLNFHNQTTNQKYFPYREKFSFYKQGTNKWTFFYLQTTSRQKKLQTILQILGTYTNYNAHLIKVMYKYLFGWCIYNFL